jgi:hypothetical protein
MTEEDGLGMWIGADELQDAIAIYVEELRGGGARAVETQTETEGALPRLSCELSDASGDFIVVIPSATLVPMCMSLLPLLRSASDPAAIRGLLSDQLMGLWSEIELERRRHRGIAEIVL